MICQMLSLAAVVVVVAVVEVVVAVTAVILQQNNCQWPVVVIEKLSKVVAGCKLS